MWPEENYEAELQANEDQLLAEKISRLSDSDKQTLYESGNIVELSSLWVKLSIDTLLQSIQYSTILPRVLCQVTSLHLL